MWKYFSLAGYTAEEVKMLRTALALLTFVAVLAFVCGVFFTGSVRAQSWKNYGIRSGRSTGPGGGL